MRSSHFRLSHFLIIPLLLLLQSTVFGQNKDDNEYNVAEKLTIYSKVLNEDREILIYKPKGFWGMDETAEQYPVVFVLDGESQFLHTLSTIDYISGAPMGMDIMPRSIVVGIPNTDRMKDLTPTQGILGSDSTSFDQTGGGKQFLDFITNELSPYLDGLYNTSKHKTIIGHSLGGLIVFEALMNKSNHFTNYLAIDPALGYDNKSYLLDVIAKLDTSDLKEEHLFLATSNSIPPFLDVNKIGGDDSDIVDIYKGCRKFVIASQHSKWKLNFSHKHYPTETHFSIPHPATYDGLKYFYSYYPFNEIMNYYHPSYKDSTDLLAKLKTHYQTISTHMGYEVIPMEGYINSFAFGLSHYDRSDLTLALLDYNIELYPNKPTALNNKGHFLKNQGLIKEAIVIFEKSLVIKNDEEIVEVIEGMREKVPNQLIFKYVYIFIAILFNTNPNYENPL